MQSFIMEKALNFQIIFKFPFWVQSGVANANTCMSKNVVNCNSVTVELPIYKVLCLPFTFTQIMTRTLLGAVAIVHQCQVLCYQWDDLMNVIFTGRDASEKVWVG